MPRRRRFAVLAAVLLCAGLLAACAPDAPPLDTRATNVVAGNIIAREYGWDQNPQWGCLYELWQRESGWNHLASNPSGAYGIPQALPGSKMAAYGDDWRTNPGPQIKWGLAYIAGRYGTPCNALGHFRASNWY
jgi:hypothetical protein